jgi:hypothetical protein
MEQPEERRRNIEWLKCSQCIDYWIEEYVFIFNATLKDWIAFELWPAQSDTLTKLSEAHQSIVLKARQLGLSWLVLCYALHSMLFRPAATILLFSKRDEEAIELLKRLKGCYERLPRWMQARTVAQDSLHDFELSNGSSAKSFPSTGGRSYTGSLVIVDEAEFVQDLDELINAVKPTIDAGGQMIMISTVDKSQPESSFKRIFRAAKRKESDWQPIFLAWHARPGRDDIWYRSQKADVLARTGALDDLYQEYPATDSEALASRQLDKRIPTAWLNEVYQELPRGLPGTNPLGIPGLAVYREPQLYADPARKLGKATYRIGCDPAEGNPSSDDSAATVVDERTGEEMAVLCGKLQPSTFAAYIARLAAWYNGASVLVERNNHGHAVLLWLQDNSKAALLNGPDDRAGWPTTSKSKAQMYDDFTDKVRDQEIIIHSSESYMQLDSIDGSTLSAPDGMHDDRAVSFVLATLSSQLLAPQKRAGTW